MGRPLRMYKEDAIYFVTARVIQGRMLLRPSTDSNEVIGGVLARSVARHKVQLHAFVVTSNHVHLLLQARDGALSAFMQYLLGNLARKVGRLVNWRGTFWERRFSAEEVLDDAAALGRLRYILAHGVKEGLVRAVEEWPGLSCASQLLTSEKKHFNWFNWAKRWHRARLAPNAPGLTAEDIAEKVELVLTPLPAWAALSESERQSAARALVDDINLKGRQTHRSVLGVKAICKQDPQSRPTKLKRSPRPVCHASDLSHWRAWRQQYREFALAYRLASQAFRGGEWAPPFAPLAFRPPCHHHHRR